MSKVAKALGALLGGITGGAVVVLAGSFGLDITPELGAAVALVLGTVGAYLAPKNTDPNES